MGEIIDHIKNFKVVGKYNNAYLDDLLYGIAPEDFVLIGADTGVGKTEFAYDIAFNNALTKHVHLFALEADVREPWCRRLYKIVSEMFFNDSDRDKSIMLTYDRFMYGKVNVDKYLAKAEAFMDEKYYRLHVHYRERNFDVNTLNAAIADATHRDGCDMIVIDHLDYFDFSPEHSENLQMNILMKQLREINQTCRIPIIAISHLRKKGSRKVIMPGYEDFIGSSSKIKQVKTIILMAKDYSVEGESHQSHTLISVPKRRIGGAPNYVGRIIYDLRKNSYDNQYELFYNKEFGEKLDPVPADKIPLWGERAVRGETQGYEMVSRKVNVGLWANDD